MAVTADDLLRRVRARLSERDPDFFTDQDVYDWLNEGQDVICAAVPYTAQTTWGATIPPGATSVRLPAETIQATGAALVSTTGRQIVLDYVEPDVLDRSKTFRARPRPGTPVRFTVRTMLDGRVVEWDASQSENTLVVVKGHMRPRAMDESTDETDVPYYVSHALVDYAVWQAKLKDEEPRQADQAAAKFAADMVELDVRMRVDQAAQFNRVRLGREISGRPGLGWWRDFP